MAAPEKVKGPAAYFPSSEKTYGQPMEHWFALVRQQQGQKHMEIVNWLKAEHGMGHGHANAVVAYCLAGGGGIACGPPKKPAQGCRPVSMNFAAMRTYRSC